MTTAAYRQRVQSWLDEGAKQNALHMFVVFDAYDEDEFPLFVHPGMNAENILATLPSDVQCPLFCFTYDMSLDEQLEKLIAGKNRRAQASALHFRERLIPSANNVGAPE